MGKNKKFIILLFLIFVFFTMGALWSAKKNHSIENQLFLKWFVDAPERSQAMGIAPSLAEQGDEIISACRAADLLTPVLPTADMKGKLYQRTTYLPIENDTQCRCTYYIYVDGDEVKSLWIEARYVENDYVFDFPCQIFSAKASRLDIINFYTGK